MSQRTTDKLGAAAASGDGGEGSPVETDPLGGSVGTSTPYIQQFNSGWEPSPVYPMLHSYFDDAPQYVNGQRVSCTLDGMAVGCSQAYHMLDVGSAIPAALEKWQQVPGFSFESLGLGIFKTTFPDIYINPRGGFVTQPAGIAPIEGNRLVFEGGSSIFSISWSPQGQNDAINVDIPFTSEDIRYSVKLLLSNPRCSDFVNKLVKTASELYGKIIDKNPDLSAVDSIIANIGEIEFFFNQTDVKRSDGNYPAHPHNTIASGLPVVVHFPPGINRIGSFVNPMKREYINIGEWVRNVNQQLSIENIRDFRDRIGLIGLHEVIHTLGNGFSDPNLAFATDKVTGKTFEDQKSEESSEQFNARASNFWQAALSDHCKRQ